MWKYDSPIGTLYIRRIQSGKYGLIYNGIVWEACDTPEIEADNVYMQCTGCSEWDMFDASEINVPSDLSEWEYC